MSEVARDELKVGRKVELRPNIVDRIPPGRQFPTNRLPSHPTLHKLATIMSTLHVNTKPSSSSNFQEIFCLAVKAYEKRTKRDLLAHPLASQLQACDSSASILEVLQRQVDDLDKVRNGDERLTKWLNPTVNVLLMFSATIGGGVSLVRIKFSRRGLQFYSNS